MSHQPDVTSLSQVLTVSQLNRLAREVLEAEIPLLWVGGEVSNLTRAASGHWYFSLKDAQAQLRCVMFRNRNQLLDFRPENGMAVEARGLVTLYEARGEFQLNVEALRPAGLGALYAAFAQLRERLAREGLFDAAAKRPLPRHPRSVGVVTSPAAAALRDVLTTLGRRMPSLPVIIYPTPVQGNGAGARIAEAIATAGRRAECDVLILCRGGGSIEDLWAFNEEAVARAIRACPVPVVTGVGHETDFTIADFAADMRAATPTAAAAACSPDAAELRAAVALLRSQLARQITRTVESHMQRVDYLSRRLLHPGERIAQRAANLQHIQQRLRSAAGRRVDAARWRCEALSARLATAAPEFDTHARRQQELARRLAAAAGSQLERARESLSRIEAHLLHLNPEAVLQRGYSIAQRADGTIVRDGASLAPGDELALTLARGWARSRVTESG